jgi:hypothetical protein
MYKQFGDPHCHLPHTGSTTTSQIMSIESMVDPWDLPFFVPEAKKLGLNSVHRPLQCPSSFLA